MLKLYYSIKEVSELVDEEQHILRYWEKEFSQLKPKKNRGGNRTYSLKDIDMLKYIKKLMRDDKLSLKGAKDILTKSNVNLNEFDTNIAKEILYENELYNDKQSLNVIENIIESNSNSSIEIKKAELRAIYNLLKDTLELIKN